MLYNFANVAVFITLAVLFVGVTLVLGRLLRPHNPSEGKSEPYECGEKPVGQAWINFNIRFYLVALLFIIFDVEIALMFPIAAVFKKWVAEGRGIIALVEMGIFLVILLFGLVYAWRKKDLDWVKAVRN